MDYKKILPKRLLLQEEKELRQSYTKTSLKRYIEIMLSMIIFFIVGKTLIEFYMLIPSMDADIGFFMSQSMIVMMVVAGFLISMDLSIGGRLRRIERNQVDLMLQLRIQENDMEIMNDLAEKINIIGKK